MSWLKGNMAAPSMVTRDGDNLVIRSVVSGDALFGTSEKQEESLVPPPEEPPPEEFLPQTRVKRNYSCSSCDFTTQNPRNFLYHMRDDHKQKFKIYECPRCLYASRHSQKLHRHMHMVHVLGATKRKPSARLRRAKPRQPRPEPPKAPPLLPDTEFTLSDEGSSIVYKCSDCDFQSKSQTILFKHERVVHLKKKIFRCNKCDYATYIRARFTKHVKYHSMPMIKCDICDFRTPYKWNLERHNKNHQGDGAFKCEVCNFTADIKQSLTVHELNHHTTGPQPTSRRRYKVGSSDNLSYDDQMEILHFESKEANSISKAERLALKKSNARGKQAQKKGSMGQLGVQMGGEGHIRVKCRSCLFSHESLEQVRAHEMLFHKDKKKSARPIPNLIPIGPQKKPGGPSMSDNDMNEICSKSAKTSSLKDFASLIGDDNAFTGEEFRPPHKQTNLLRLTPDNRSSSPDSADSKKETKRKSGSFFNKLQEKLMTGTTEADLLCSVCGYQAKCLSELVKHKESLHPEEEALESATCQCCGLVCRSTAELTEHSRTCGGQNDATTDTYHEEETQDKHPMENKVFVWNTFQQDVSEHVSEDVQLIKEKLGDPNKYIGTEIKPGYGTARLISQPEDYAGKATLYNRKAYKCPHCDFWASTASRFHVHIVGHLNKRPFRCSLCQYSSNWRWDITKHIRLKGFRDPGHQGAKVLLTDEAGMRDYAKYNRYLALIKFEPSPNGAEKPKRILPKALSAANSNLKRNKSPVQGLEEPPSKKNRLYNTKKMWKCKKCNYRNGDRQVVLAHVRAHYYPEGAKKDLEKPKNNRNNKSAENKQVNSKILNELSDEEANQQCEGFMCETCPFVGDTMKELEIHSEKHFISHGPSFKCKTCPYYALTIEELNTHCTLHGDQTEAVQKTSIFACLLCPFYGWKKGQLLYHRKWHDSSKSDGTHKCSKCTYGAPNNTILALHMRLHRHQAHDLNLKKAVITSVPAPAPPSSNCSTYADISGIDTSKFNEIPLAWVCKGSRISKMFKCRYCPHVNIRKPNILEHEKMHSCRTPGKGGVALQHRCNQCNYTCNNAGVLSSHAKVHQAFFGTVCAIADPSRPDEEQIEEVKQKMIQDELSDLKGDAVVGQTAGDNKPGTEKHIHFCSTCPARFLYPKELLIHCRFHVLKLPFRCETCTYTARQRQHLFIHKKVHTTDYHERTKILMTSYSESPENPRPKISNVSTSSGVLWVVTKEEPCTVESFKCTKCPAKFDDKDSFERHFAFHGWPGKFKCKFCDYTVLLFTALIEHELLHIEEEEPSNDTKVSKPPEVEVKPKIDPEFGSQIQGSPDFVYPVTIRNGKKKEKRYKCHKCPSAFEKRIQYKIHMSLHGSKQRYKCDKCDYSVKYYANYVQHIKKHSPSHLNGSKESDENITDEMISEDNSEDIKIAPEMDKIEEKSKKGMNMCLADEQTTEFIKKRDASNRFVTEPVHRCNMCPYTSTRRDAVTSHAKCHSAIRGKCYTCKYCNYRVPQGRFFREHVKAHFTPMKYVRPECYMKINQLEIWAEPVDQNENSDKFLIFKDNGEEKTNGDRFYPKCEQPEVETPIKGRVYINLKTGEEEIESDDEAVAISNMEPETVEPALNEVSSPVNNEEEQPDTVAELEEEQHAEEPIEVKEEETEETHEEESGQVVENGQVLGVGTGGVKDVDESSSSSTVNSFSMSSSSSSSLSPSTNSTQD